RDEEGSVRLRAALRDAVVEVGGTAAAEQIDCGFSYGGAVTVARNAAQLARLERAAEKEQAWGDDVRVLDAAQAREHARAEGVLGGTYSPDAAVLDPLRLVRGLADVVQARGARVHERTRVRRVSPGAVVTDHGTVRTPRVVRAAGAWTCRLSGSRDVAPLVSTFVATEPLPEFVWAQLGFAAHETVLDARRLHVRVRRSDDGRLVAGGPAVPDLGVVERTGDPVGRLHRALTDLFPVLADVRLTHRWDAPLGLRRDGRPAVGYDADDGLAWIEGVGDDAAVANLAGRTVAALVAGTDDPLVHLPWVGHRSAAWEPEPVRTAGLVASRLADAWADRVDRWTAQRAARAGR
ncbi:NAD(P)/FAD-dependent oxidoreductase, partial [Cellulomonas massiliensis]|uniref:NAD(P)/FAD-dependent oxidoreductase n=1 Tax=Cellulomonas massiliensis TaxID=1465811 RepID=UPI001C54C039